MPSSWCSPAHTLAEYKANTIPYGRTSSSARTPEHCTHSGMRHLTHAPPRVHCPAGATDALQVTLPVLPVAWPVLVATSFALRPGANASGQWQVCGAGRAEGAGRGARGPAVWLWGARWRHTKP